MNTWELKLCDIQGRLFELSADHGYASTVFVRLFMRSEVAKALDSSYHRMQWAGEEYLLEEVLSLVDREQLSGGNILSKDVLYWMGYLYRYWHFCTSEKSEKIYQQAPVETMRRNYLLFHTMSPELAIERLKEINQQKKGTPSKPVPDP